jgi:hypothetical protein
MCAFLGYCTWLQDAGIREDMLEGVQCLQYAATRMHEMARRNSTPRLTDGEPNEDEEVIVD